MKRQDGAMPTIKPIRALRPAVVAAFDEDGTRALPQKGRGAGPGVGRSTPYLPRQSGQFRQVRRQKVDPWHQSGQKRRYARLIQQRMTGTGQQNGVEHAKPFGQGAGDGLDNLCRAQHAYLDGLYRPCPFDLGHDRVHRQRNASGDRVIVLRGHRRDRRTHSPTQRLDGDAIAQKPGSGTGIRAPDAQDGGAGPRAAHAPCPTMATRLWPRSASRLAARHARKPVEQTKTTRCPGAGSGSSES